MEEAKYPDYKELKLSDAFKDVEGLKLADNNAIPYTGVSKKGKNA